jgi:hypothetical protein
MRGRFIAFVGFLLLGCWVCAAQADQILNFTGFVGASGQPAITPALNPSFATGPTVTLEDDPTPGLLDVTVTAPYTNYYIRDVYFTLSSLINVANVSLASTSFNGNAVSVGGNITMFSYPGGSSDVYGNSYNVNLVNQNTTAPTDGIIGSGNSFTFVLKDSTDGGLTTNDVKISNSVVLWVNDPYVVAATSYTSGPQDVPEPKGLASLLGMAGIGGLGMVGQLWRRRRR